MTNHYNHDYTLPKISGCSCKKNKTSFSVFYKNKEIASVSTPTYIGAYFLSVWGVFVNDEHLGCFVTIEEAVDFIQKRLKKTKP